MYDALARTRWRVFPDAEAVAQAAADWILEASERAIREHGAFRLVLAGGTTPERTYRLLARTGANWDRWRIYFGDERCLPKDDPKRNSRAAAAAWLEPARVPSQCIFPIPAELGAETAANAYAAEIRPVLPLDLVLLGIGEDGHTASLFPGHQHAENELTHPVHDAPKPPPDRVSLSRRALGNTRQLLILVTGVGKRSAVRAWKQGEPLPVASVCSPSGVDVLIDSAANDSPCLLSSASPIRLGR